jgi:hypothetical protein
VRQQVRQWRQAAGCLAVWPVTTVGPSSGVQGAGGGRQCEGCVQLTDWDRVHTPPCCIGRAPEARTQMNVGGRCHGPLIPSLPRNLSGSVGAFSRPAPVSGQACGRPAAQHSMCPTQRLQTLEHSCRTTQSCLGRSPAVHIQERVEVPQSCSSILPPPATLRCAN